MKAKVILFLFLISPILATGEPLPAISNLMKQQASLFDFGLLKLQMELVKVQVTDPNIHFSTYYDSNSDRIIISGAGKNFKDETEAKEYVKPLMAKVKGLFVSTNSKGKKEYFLAPFFSRDGTRSRATAAKELDEKLKSIVEIQITVTFEEEEKGGTELLGKAKLTDDETIYSMKALK